MTISRHHIGRNQVKEEHIPAGEIPYEDLTLTDKVVNADIKSNAAIALSKIQGNIRVGTVSIDLPSIAADASGSADGTITGAKTTDIIIVTPPKDLANLVFCGASITAADTVTVTAYNPTAAAIDKAALDFAYLLYTP